MNRTAVNSRLRQNSATLTSIPRQVALRPVSSESLHDGGSAVEHHFQFAADRDELPAFLDAVAGFLGATAVEPRGHLVLVARLEDMRHGLRGGRAAGRLAVLATHAGGQVVRAHKD